jgi:hypothetical protein
VTVCASRHIKLVLGAKLVADLMINLKYGPLVVANYMKPNPEGARDCGG